MMKRYPIAFDPYALSHNGIKTRFHLLNLMSKGDLMWVRQNKFEVKKKTAKPELTGLTQEDNVNRDCNDKQETSEEFQQSSYS